jgi:hypothetical protein
MKRAGHRFAAGKNDERRYKNACPTGCHYFASYVACSLYFAVANRIICCPGTPPPSGSTPSAEESAEKFNDFLASKGPEVSSFDEDDDKSQVGSVSMAGEAVIWVPGEQKKPAPIKTAQTSVKVPSPPTIVQSEAGNGAEAKPVNDKENDNLDSDSHTVVQDEPVSSISDVDSLNQSPSLGSNEAIIVEPAELPASQERPFISSNDEEETGQPDKPEDNTAQVIPIEAFIPPHKIDSYDPHTNKFSDQLITSMNNGEQILSSIQSSLEDPSNGIHDESGGLSGPFSSPGGSSSQEEEAEASTITSTTFSTSSTFDLPNESRKNSTFIQIQPEPVVGANGKFTLEKGVHVEKATSATPRPKPNPAHQTTIGETTVNIIKTEIPIDSSPILLISPNKDQIIKGPMFSSKIPSKEPIPERETEVNSQNDQEGNNENTIDDETISTQNGIETTTGSSVSGNDQFYEEITTTTQRFINADSVTVESSGSTLSADDGENTPSIASDDDEDNFGPSTTVRLFDDTNAQTTLPTQQAIPEETPLNTLDHTTTDRFAENEEIANNHLNDQNSDQITDAPTTYRPKITSSEEVSTTGSYDVNPTTNINSYFDDESHHQSDQGAQTTIPAGHYLDDSEATTFRPTTGVPQRFNEATTTVTPQYDESLFNDVIGNDNISNHASDQNDENSGLYTTEKSQNSEERLFTTVSPVQNDEVPLEPEVTSAVTTSPSEIPQQSTTQYDSSPVPTQSGANQDNIPLSQSDEETYPGESSSADQGQTGENKNPGEIQLFLGQPTAPSQEVQPVDESAELQAPFSSGSFPPNAVSGGSNIRNPIKNKPHLAGILGIKEVQPTATIQGDSTKIPSQVHEDDSMESERDAPYPSAPNEWSIDKLHLQHDKLKPLITNGVSSVPVSSESFNQGHESNELNEGVHEENQSHSAEYQKPSENDSSQFIKGSSEDSVNSSEEEKKGASSSVEGENDENGLHNGSNEGSSVESVEALVPHKQEVAIPIDSVTFGSSDTLESATEAPSTPNPSSTQPTEHGITVGEIDTTTAFSTSLNPSSTQTTTNPPTATPELGGINIKPQDGSGEVLPQHQILSACATQDYYRSLEQESSTKQYPFLV